MARAAALLPIGACMFAGCATLFGVADPVEEGFRRAVVAQVGGDESRAEVLYLAVLAIDAGRAPAWNNLAVIAAHRGQMDKAHRLLAKAVDADPTDLIALTNYGVMSFYVSDSVGARNALLAARQLRRENIARAASGGRASWEEDRYARATASLDETAARYLARLGSGRDLTDGIEPDLGPAAVLVAETDPPGRF